MRTRPTMSYEFSKSKPLDGERHSHQIKGKGNGKKRYVEEKIPTTSSVDFSHGKFAGSITAEISLLGRRIRDKYGR
jgi:hypothetical protein